MKQKLKIIIPIIVVLIAMVVVAVLTFSSGTDESVTARAWFVDGPGADPMSDMIYFEAYVDEDLELYTPYLNGHFERKVGSEWEFVREVGYNMLMMGYEGYPEPRPWRFASIASDTFAWLTGSDERKSFDAGTYRWVMYYSSDRDYVAELMKQYPEYDPSIVPDASRCDEITAEFTVPKRDEKAKQVNELKLKAWFVDGPGETWYKDKIFFEGYIPEGVSVWSVNGYGQLERKNGSKWELFKSYGGDTTPRVFNLSNPIETKFSTEFYRDDPEDKSGLFPAGKYRWFFKYCDTYGEAFDYLHRKSDECKTAIAEFTIPKR